MLVVTLVSFCARILKSLFGSSLEIVVKNGLAPFFFIKECDKWIMR